jgi:hypothetical protein
VLSSVWLINGFSSRIYTQLTLADQVVFETFAVTFEDATNGFRTTRSLRLQADLGLGKAIKDALTAEGFFADDFVLESCERSQDTSSGRDQRSPHISLTKDVSELVVVGIKSVTCKV